MQQPQTVTARYNPSIFDAQSIEHAMGVILTPEPELSTAQRWERETPYLADLIEKNIKLGPDSVVLDYGCGVGRLSRELIARAGCRVMGIDISSKMRGLAADYVASDRFVAAAPSFVDAMSIRADAVIAVWVLQHCRVPSEDIMRIFAAMKSGARLFVLNERYRCVPTIEHGWIDDRRDVFSIIEDCGGKMETECMLDPSAVGARIAGESLARVYVKATGRI